MKHETASAISHITSMAMLIGFIFTDELVLAVGAVIFTVLSSESSILSAIEKTKEGR